MKKLTLILVVLSVSLFSIPISHGEYSEGEKGNENSPYFFVQSDDPSLDPFPLLETKAKVNIAGVIAEMELVQVYKNEGKRTIEAVYVFPLGTKAAIHGMKMKIGDREINATIEERETAQAVYNNAKQAGKVASLLEQERPNVFQMKVANIMPGDIVEVTVGYTELLIPEKGIYEYVFPTVVGPRYNGEMKKDSDRDQWIKTAYLHEGKEPSYKFDIEVNLKTGIPISRVWTPSHSVKITQEGDEARIELSDDETKGANRDFILRYALKGEEIQTGLLLYPGEEEKFFLLMAQPPQKIELEEIPPREYIFIVDVSGSMNGFPLDVSKELVRTIINNLRGKDYFNILFFAGGSEALSEYPLLATKENREKAIAMLNNQRGTGGTNMLAALKKAVSLEKKEGVSRTVVIITDGYVAIEKEIFDLIKDRLSEANFFAFGIGSSVNRYLIEGIARVGMGEPFVVVDKKEAEKAADKFSEYISSPLLTNVRLDFIGFDAYEVEPVNVPDLFAERPLIIYGKYNTAGGKIIIRGNRAHGNYAKKIEVNPLEEDKNNIALKYLWAREKIARLSDYRGVGSDVKKEVTLLGLKYSLMTDYTSFVAVDTVVRDTGETVTVKQPLPLPQGVSDYAVGEARGMAYNGFICMEKGRSAPMEGLRLYNPELDAGAGISGGPERKDAAIVCLTGGKFPNGITMKEVEKLLLPLKEEMGKLFNEWKLKRVHIVLTIEKGMVKDAQIKSYEGKNCKSRDLETLLKKISFPSSLTGTMELELDLV